MPLPCIGLSLPACKIGYEKTILSLRADIFVFSIIVMVILKLEPGQPGITLGFSLN